MTPDELRATFHAQVRLTDRDAAPGLILEHVGPIHRHYPQDPQVAGAMIESPEGLGDDPVATVAEQRDFFAGRGQRVEWKTYSYDPPEELGLLLSAAGFVKEDDEALLLGEMRDLAQDRTVEGVVVREANRPGDLELIGDLHELVWPGSRWVTERFAAEQQDVPDELVAFLAEPVGGGLALNAAWVRLTPETSFAGMWGGATHPEWRRRGLYAAVLAARARWALERGYTLARVDASPESEPILRRLGLHRVATTVPYILDPTPTAS